MKRFAIALALGLACTSLAQCQAPPPPKLPDIHFPNPPAPKPPNPPAPVPGSAFQLKPGVLYVVTSSAPVAMVASPSNVVSITAGQGPLQIFGTFSDGAGTPEFRTYKEPNLYIVTATAAGGSCELIGVRSLTDLSSVSRQAITTTVTPPDPGPGPGPDPGPGPGPTPTPSPFPGKGLRVLIVFEKSELGKLPPAQLNAVYSENVRNYLESHCVVGENGKLKDYRYYDQNDDPKNDSKVFRDAMARARTNVPWIVIGNGDTGYEGGLPLDEKALMDLLKKYGGA